MTKMTYCVPCEGNTDALHLVHPHGDVPMKAHGAWWPEDAFTARMIVDGVVKRTEQHTSVPAVGPEAMMSQARPRLKPNRYQTRFDKYEKTSL